MSTATTKTATAQSTNESNTQSAGITGTDVLLGALKLAGLAFTAYKAVSHRKQEQQAAALNTRSNNGSSMSSLDPNALMNMGLQHMRNMNRFLSKM